MRCSELLNRKREKLEIAATKLMIRKKGKALRVLSDQLTLVRLKHAAVLFNSFVPACSMDCLVSFSDDSELHMRLDSLLLE